MNQQGLDYIRNQLDQGVDRILVRQAMITAGWQADDVDQMLKTVEGKRPNFPMPPVKSSVSTNNKTNIFAKVILILVVVIGLVTLSYFLFFSPQRVLVRALGRLDSVKSYSYQFNFDSKLSDTPIINQPLAHLYNSSRNQKTIAGLDTDNDSIKQVQNSSVEIKIDGEGQISFADLKNILFELKLDYAMQEGTNPKETAAAETRFITDTLYFKINQIPKELDDYVDTTTILNQWISVALNDYDQNPEKLTENFPDAGQYEKIKKAYAANPFINIGNNIKLGRSGSVPVFKYSYSIDKEKLKQFIVEGNKSLKKPAEEVDLEYASEEVNNMPEVNGEIWIGIFDTYVYHFTMDFSSGKDEFLFVNGQYRWEMNFSKYNSSLKIETPASSKNFEQVMEEMEKKWEEKVKADRDNDGVTDIFENYWKTNPDKTDTDGDGYSDLAEICNDYDPTTLEKQTENQRYLPRPEKCYNELGVK